MLAKTADQPLQNVLLLQSLMQYGHALAKSLDRTAELLGEGQISELAGQLASQRSIDAHWLDEHGREVTEVFLLDATGETRESLEPSMVFMEQLRRRLDEQARRKQ
jgi:hypothetical protein